MNDACEVHLLWIVRDEWAKFEYRTAEVSVRTDEHLWSRHARPQWRHDVRYCMVIKLLLEETELVGIISFPVGCEYTVRGRIAKCAHSRNSDLLGWLEILLEQQPHDAHVACHW